MNTETLPSIQSAEVSEAQSAAYQGMARQKNILTAKLGGMELQAQSILLPVMDSQVYADIDAALIAYRKLNTEITETRKPFTNAVDAGIVQPLMQYEKRVKEAPEYATLVTRSLTLRKAESENAAKANAKAQEIARFKAHVENEFFRVAAEYRTLLSREITGQYQIALREKLSGDTSDIKKMLQTLSVPPTNKFQTNVLSGEEMMKIYEGVPKPFYGEMYARACEDLDTLFANFSSDLANAEAAIKHQEQQQKLAEMENQKKLAEEMAMTTLIATAETVVIDEPKIKRSLTVVEENSWKWTKSVMMAAILNERHLEKYFRIKNFSKLSFGQLAEYLGKYASETGVTFTNLKMEEVEK